jgi:protein NirF
MFCVESWFRPFVTAASALASAAVLLGCAAAPIRSSGDLGVVIERASGSIQIVENTTHGSVARLTGLGDLSHAAVVYSRDARFAYVFGRDGGLTQIDLLAQRVVARTIQSGNSIGGAISSDGKLIAVANYDPGGIKIFDAATLEQLSEVPSYYGTEGKRAKVVGIGDVPGRGFVFSLFEGNAIWLVDTTDPRAPQVRKFDNAGSMPYDGLVTPDGRHYIAGLFGEDGAVLLDLWNPDAGVTRILDGYGRGGERLPVYKMPHLRGWAIAGDYAFLPAVGRHEVLVVDRRSWKLVSAIPVHGQPVFVMGRPDGRQVWVNFAFPRNGVVQVIDVPTLALVRTLEPGRAVLHMEFTARGDQIWISARDDNKLVVYDTQRLQRVAELPAASPSGIFFTWRAHKIGL